MDRSIWDNWKDVHSDPEQQKRLKLAKEAACTPVSVDKEAGTADIIGKHGEYFVSLDGCDCLDFMKRKLPCKHMYRLALELGLVPGEYLSYLHGGYPWKKAVELIEEHPEEVQSYFYYSCFRTAMKKKEPFRLKKNPCLDELIQAGFLIEYPEKETPKFKTISVIEDFFFNTRKLQFYFSRKFSPPTYFNGFEMVRDELPEDDVTAFLRERGFVE